MRITRRSLKSSLTQAGAVPTPTVDDAFVDRLEQRLLSDDSTAPLVVDNVIALHGRVRRAVVIGVVAATLTGAAAAAALIVGTGDDSHRIITATEPTLPGTATTINTETTSTTSSLPTTTTSSVAPETTTTMATSPPTTQGNAAAPSTTDLSPSVPGTTSLPDTTTMPDNPASTTTEVHVPATLGISCVPDGSNVKCTWTPGPAGTDHYLVLRSRPGGVDGRALTPIAGQLTYADTQIVSGDSFSYLIHAFDAAGHSLAHSEPYSVVVP